MLNARCLLSVLLVTLIWMTDNDGRTLRAQNYPIGIVRSDDWHHYTLVVAGTVKEDCYVLEFCIKEAERVASEMDQFHTTNQGPPEPLKP